MYRSSILAIAVGILSASAAAAKGYGLEVQPHFDADQPSDSFFGEELFGAAPQPESTYRLGEFRAKGQAPGASDYVSSSSSSQGTIFDTADYDLPSLQIQTPLLAQADIAQYGSTSAPSELTEAQERARIAEAMANPLSSLWLIFMQNDTTWYDGDILDTLGEGTQVKNITSLQPVMPFQLTEDWKVIFRPVIPINSFETVKNLDVAIDNDPSITGKVEILPA